MRDTVLAVDAFFVQLWKRINSEIILWKWTIYNTFLLTLFFEQEDAAFDQVYSTSVDDV